MLQSFRPRPIARPPPTHTTRSPTRPLAHPPTHSPLFPPGRPATTPVCSTNHLGHFLLVNLLLEDLKNAPKNNPAGSPRCIIVGSITGNTNTLAGNVPPKADLGDLRGMNAALVGRSSSMIDGGDFDGAKAYKDSKVRARMN